LGGRSGGESELVDVEREPLHICDYESPVECSILQGAHVDFPRQHVHDVIRVSERVDSRASLGSLPILIRTGVEDEHVTLKVAHVSHRPGYLADEMASHIVGKQASGDDMKLVAGFNYLL
jgi:hypothetical protein